MNVFRRFVLPLLLCFVCVVSQGVSAHEHQRIAVSSLVHATHVVDRTVPADVTGQSTPSLHEGGDDHPHGPCSCCATSCGLHCCAMPASFAFEPRTPLASLPRPDPDAPRDGVVHAPGLRPPIV